MRIIARHTDRTAMDHEVDDWIYLLGAPTNRLRQQGLEEIVEYLGGWVEGHSPTEHQTQLWSAVEKNLLPSDNQFISGAILNLLLNATGITPSGKAGRNVFLNDSWDESNTAFMKNFSKHLEGIAESAQDRWAVSLAKAALDILKETDHPLGTGLSFQKPPQPRDFQTVIHTVC